MIYLISNTPFDDESVEKISLCDIKFNKFNIDLSEFDALIVTSKNGINMVVDGVDYIPKWSDTVPDLNADTISGSKENAFKGDKVQQSYINMSMNINSVEFKEWFMFTNGSLGNATISEIGLVIGLDCVKDRGITQPMSSVSPDADNYNTLAMYSEIYDAELFAHLTFDPYTVARDNAAIDFAYRVFA